MGDSATTTDAPAACTQAEFARRHGWSKSYVTALKHAGRLVVDSAGLVDVAASLERIQATTQRVSQASEPALPPPLRAHRDRKEFYDAENARIDLEERLGKLLRADQVLDAVSDAAALFAGQLDALPDRLAPQIASMAADEGRIRAVLADAIDSVRRDMVARLKAVMP
jgi:hypothetical protein